MKTLRYCILSAIVFFVLSAYFIYIAVPIHLTAGQVSYSNKLFSLGGGEYNATIATVGLGAIIAFIGVGIGLLMAAKKKSRELIMLLLFTAATMLALHLEFFGFSEKIVVESRWILPLVLAPWLGIAIHYIIGAGAKQAGSPPKLRPVISAMIALALIIIMFNTYADYRIKVNLMDRPHWESLEWLSQDTPKDSEVFFFYSSNYYHYYNKAFMGGKRVSYLANIEYLGSSINSGTIRRGYLNYPTDQVVYYYRTGFFSVANHADEDPDAVRKNRDICSMDYVVFDITEQSAAPPLTQYNFVIRESLLQRGNFNEEFNNNVVSILKNNNPGEECRYGVEEGMSDDEKDRAAFREILSFLTNQDSAGQP